MITPRTLLKSARMFVSIFALAAFGGPALNAHDDSAAPPIWEVSDDDTTIYLFGLPNIMDEATDWRSAAFEQALAEAEVIMLESDRQSPEAQAKIQRTIPQIGVFRDGTKMTEVVDEETRAQLERVSRSLGLPLQGIEQLKPWLAANQLQSVMTQRQGLMAAPTPTSVIIAQAKESGVSVSYLEGSSDLLFAVGRLPIKTQVRMLKQSLDTIENEPGEAKRVLALWARGDVDGLVEALHGEDAWADETVLTAMLLERNRTWLARLKEVMQFQTGVIFVAVGIGHLVGEESLPNGLAGAGFEVQRK
ncbi:TraB/GumN family protein [Erythrobacter sp. GH1-10]|uniref:TraB/GumN family protein n=1 Tax=Erythrobacter sp. GH1-10 TaxID=3349334 RepID=UPI003877D035